MLRYSQATRVAFGASMLFLTDNRLATWRWIPLCAQAVMDFVEPLDFRVRITS
jgi:hypothetical protein